MGTTLAQRIQDNIRWVADFPEEGVHFADLTPVLADPQIFNGIMRQMSDWAGEVDIIAGLDAPYITPL